MPLDEILDDIIEDKQNTENKETTTEIAPEVIVVDSQNTPEVTKTDEVVDVNKEVEGTPEEAPSDSDDPKAVEDVVESIKKNIEIYNVVEDIKKQEVLDKSTAMEVFTMLPIGNESLSNRLTVAPSKNNVKLINTVLESYNSGTLVEDTYTLNTIISKLIERSEALQTLPVTEYYERFINWNETKHLIIYDKRTYDLSSSPIVAITTIDDKALMYQPFEDVLTSLYTELWHAAYNLKDIYIDMNSIDLHSLVLIINNSKTTIISNIEMLKNLRSKINDINNNGCNEYVFDYNDLDIVVNIKNKISFMETVRDNKILDLIDKVLTL